MFLSTSPTLIFLSININSPESPAIFTLELSLSTIYPGQKNKMAANSTENEPNLLNELLGFLSLNSREDVKRQTLEYLLGLTGSADGVKFIENNLKLVEKVVELTGDRSEGVQKDACVFLLNASASQIVARKLENVNTFQLLLRQVVDKDCIYADNVAMLLSNLTRSEQGCELCCKTIEESPQSSLQNIFDMLCNEKYNKTVELHHLAALLSNISRLKVVRMMVLDRDVGLMQKLLSYVSFQKSLVRRKGVVGIVRNCCFEYGKFNCLVTANTATLVLTYKIH